MENNSTKEPSDSSKLVWEQPVLLELNMNKAETGAFSANIEANFSDPAFDAVS